jgi:hypothetical protein
VVCRRRRCAAPTRGIWSASSARRQLQSNSPPRTASALSLAAHRKDLAASKRAGLTACRPGRVPRTHHPPEYVLTIDRLNRPRRFHRRQSDWMLRDPASRAALRSLRATTALRAHDRSIAAGRRRGRSSGAKS